MRRYVFRFGGSYWTFPVLTVVKVFYAIRWMCERKRTRFLPYFRITMTYYISMQLENISLLVMYFQTRKIAYIKWYLVILIASAILIVLNVIHLRYIDKIHFAKVELARDRYILR